MLTTEQYLKIKRLNRKIKKLKIILAITFCLMVLKALGV